MRLYPSAYEVWIGAPPPAPPFVTPETVSSSEKPFITSPEMIPSASPPRPPSVRSSASPPRPPCNVVTQFEEKLGETNTPAIPAAAPPLPPNRVPIPPAPGWSARVLRTPPPPAPQPACSPQGSPPPRLRRWTPLRCRPVLRCRRRRCRSCSWPTNYCSSNSPLRWRRPSRRRRLGPQRWSWHCRRPHPRIRL